MKCSIQSLRSLKGKDLLPYLQIEKNYLDIKEESFPCCKGEALQRTEKKEHSVTRCDLKKRLSKLKDLFFCFDDTFDEEFSLPTFANKELRTYWTWFILYGHGSQFTGYHFRTKTPHHAWALASIGIWRFGLDCFVFNIQKHPITDFITYIGQFENTSRPPIIFIESEEGLQSLKKREDITYLISWCEKHLAPLWILRPPPKKSKSLSRKSSNSMMNRFNEMISEVEQQPLDKNLEADSLSKLSSISTKLDLEKLKD